MFEMFAKHYQWVFSGVGVSVLSGLLYLWKKRETGSSGSATNISITNTVNAAVSQSGSQGQTSYLFPKESDIKFNTRILFVDDDTRFKVVKILKDAGWPYVRIIKDIRSLDAPEIIEANIIFLDIQGVGNALGFSDEGLGLAYAIKQRYPQKRVVIYSAQTSGERFHKGFQKADYILPKNADPYEFIQIVEDFS
jgi:hypothetical protein